MTKPDYTKPQVATYEGEQILGALGPVAAGSGRISIGGSDSTFRPNTNTCGTPMGYPCP